MFWHLPRVCDDDACSGQLFFVTRCLLCCAVLCCAVMCCAHHATTQVLRDQLKERHEQHERGLKEDLELRHKSSKASLLRRRQMRRRSISQSPRGGGEASRRSSFDPSPLQMPASMLPPATGAAEAAGPDLTKYRSMKTVGGKGKGKGEVALIEGRGSSSHVVFS